MGLFKSATEKHILAVQRGLANIKNQYQKLSDPVKALQKMPALTTDEKEQVKSLKRFNVYPRLGHLENTFFESEQGLSYRFQRAAQLSVIQQSKKLPPRVVSVKGKSVRFAESVGLPVPATEYPLRLEEVDFQAPCVLKPVYAEGNRCIHAIAPIIAGGFKDYFSGRSFENKAELVRALQKSLKEAGVGKDAWLKEEMVVGSSGSPVDTYDVKVYTFYGRAGLVLQVDRWRGRQYRFFDCHGQMVNSGKYSAEPGVAPVFDRKLIDAAEAVSLKIPWAHARVDFLVSDNDWRFGEFTLRPGVPASFNDEWDRELGVLFVEAQARLFEDLIAGKAFPEYQKLLRGR